MIFNKKLEEGISMFQNYYNETKYQIIFNFIINSYPSSVIQLSLIEKICIIRFLIYTFQNLDYEPIRVLLSKYFTLRIWKVLSPERLNREFKSYPQLEKHWEILEQTKNQQLSTSITNSTNNDNNKNSEDITPKKGKGKRKIESQEIPLPKKIKPDNDLETEWFPLLVEEFLFNLESNRILDEEKDTKENNQNEQMEQYINLFCELFITLFSQFSTRRFTYSVFDDYHVIIHCKRNSLYQTVNFKRLVDLLYSLFHFSVDNQTGKALSVLDMDSIVNIELQQLQQVAYIHFRDTLSDIIFSSTGELGKVENLFKHLSILSLDCLISLTQKLGYISSTQKKKIDIQLTKEFIIDILIEKLTYKKIDREFSNYILDPTGIFYN